MPWNLWEVETLLCGGARWTRRSNRDGREMCRFTRRRVVSFQTLLGLEAVGPSRTPTQSPSKSSFQKKLGACVLRGSIKNRWLMKKKSGSFYPEPPALCKNLGWMSYYGPYGPQDALAGMIIQIMTAGNVQRSLRFSGPSPSRHAMAT